MQVSPVRVMVDFDEAAGFEEDADEDELLDCLGVETFEGGWVGV
jgi:hypothetical protein